MPEREPVLEATRHERPVRPHPHAAGHAVGDAARFDFHRDPFIVFYELTRACDLACRHCRASAMRKALPGQLDAASSRQLVEQLATFDRKPIVVFTGGDPCKRHDLVELVGLANELGLKPSLAPAATPLLSDAKLAELRSAGLQRVAISLDGPDRESHEALRRVPGSFDDSLGAIARCRDAGLGLQINTTVTQHNLHRLPAMADAVEAAGAGMWAVFFLVPVGRGLREQRIAPEQYEQVFAFLHEQSGHRPFAIKTTEAPFYRRFVLQRKGDPQRGPARAPLGINDGKGVMFIAHNGGVQPSGFFDLRCGTFPRDSVVEVYRKHPTFLALRDPDRLAGKCGACEFRNVCGGSRARAFALTGDPVAQEPDCAYRPKGWKGPKAITNLEMRRTNESPGSHSETDFQTDVALPTLDA